MTTCSVEAIDKGLDPSVPIDRDKVKTRVRYLIGDPPLETVPEELLDGILASAIDHYEDSQIYECDVTYDTLIELLRYLIRKSHSDAGGGTTGNILSRKEKVGRREIEEKYESSSKSGGGVDTGWEKLYEEFIDHPERVCACLRRSTTGSATIKIGGTDKNEYDRIANDLNGRSMWDITDIGDNYTQKNLEKRIRTRDRAKGLRYRRRLR